MLMSDFLSTAHAQVDIDANDIDLVSIFKVPCTHIAASCLLSGLGCSHAPFSVQGHDLTLPCSVL